MVTDKKKDSRKRPRKQGVEDSAPEPNKINASTPYDFNGKNLTPYGGLLPVITMLEKLGFQALLEETVYDHRLNRIVNASLGDYLIPVNADIQHIQVEYLPEEDPYVNPLGVKGVGEIGMAGVAPAIANAVFHATGIRVRELPITIEKLL